MTPPTQALLDIDLPSAWLYEIAASRLAMVAQKPFKFHVPIAPTGSPTELELVQQQMSRLDLLRVSSRLSQGRWLSRLALLAAARCGSPIRILELGAFVGISGSYILAGLAKAGGGHLVTCEGSPELAALARKRLETFVAKHRLHTVTFEVVVGAFQKTFAAQVTPDKGPYAMVFIDGHHQEQPTLGYHREARKVLHPRGIIVHDDIAWSAGMARAWNRIRADEKDCAIVELYQGNRPSRGMLFYGDQPTAEPPRFHVDTLPERLLRQSLYRFQKHR
jgi:predicted O-methyltransferase YrrM